MRPAAVLVSNEHDASVDWVVRELRDRRVPYLRINAERLGQATLVVSPSAGRWRLTLAGTPYELDDVRGIWYRRPERPIGLVVDALTPAQQDLIAGQWRTVVVSLGSMPEARWINQPHRNLAAESKLSQLRAATRHGFVVPDTLVVNDRTEALQFCKQHPQGIVIKALHAPLIDEPESPSFVYTRRVDASDLAAMADPEIAPFILQEEVRPKLDVRVTMIDGRGFAAVTEPHEEVDWRTRHAALRWNAHVIPQDLEARCGRYLQEFGLRFGAFDFVRNAAGEYVFLEVNPNGEWGWLQKTCGLPIASALTDALLDPGYRG